jgi:hypothetical protein
MRQAGLVPPDVTKPDLLAAVGAADQWVDVNAPTFNLALPATFRAAASMPQKALLLAFVVMRRANQLRTEEDR